MFSKKYVWWNLLSYFSLVDSRISFQKYSYVPREKFQSFQNWDYYLKWSSIKALEAYYIC